MHVVLECSPNRSRGKSKFKRVKFTLPISRSTPKPLISKASATPKWVGQYCYVQNRRCSKNNNVRGTVLLCARQRINVRSVCLEDSICIPTQLALLLCSPHFKVFTGSPNRWKPALCATSYSRSFHVCAGRCSQQSLYSPRTYCRPS
jgi:hypothetical protein